MLETETSLMWPTSRHHQSLFTSECCNGAKIRLSEPNVLSPSFSIQSTNPSFISQFDFYHITLPSALNHLWLPIVHQPLVFKLGFQAFIQPHGFLYAPHHCQDRPTSLCSSAIASCNLEGSLFRLLIATFTSACLKAHLKCCLFHVFPLGDLALL